MIGGIFFFPTSAADINVEKNPDDDIGSANVSLRHYFYSRFFGKRSPPIDIDIKTDLQFSEGPAKLS